MNIPEIGLASSIWQAAPIVAIATANPCTAKSPAPFATIPADTQLELPFNEVAQ